MYASRMQLFATAAVAAVRMKISESQSNSSEVSLSPAKCLAFLSLRNRIPWSDVFLKKVENGF